MEFGLAHPRMIQAAWRVLLGEGFYYGKNLAEISPEDHAGAYDDDQAGHGTRRSGPQCGCGTCCHDHGNMEQRDHHYVLNEGMKQKDVLKWMRSPKTQETIDKLLYVMEYGLRKTKSEFTAGI